MAALINRWTLSQVAYLEPGFIQPALARLMLLVFVQFWTGWKAAEAGLPQ